MARIKKVLKSIVVDDAVVEHHRNIILDLIDNPKLNHKTLIPYYVGYLRLQVDKNIITIEEFLAIAKGFYEY